MQNRSPIKGQAEAGAKWLSWPLPFLILGFWTLPGLLYASQLYLGFEGSEKALSWWRLAAWQLLIYYVWAALTPLILWLGQRFTVDRIRNLALHLLFGSLISIFHIFAYTVFTEGLDIYPDWRSHVGFINRFIHFIGMYFHLDFFTYCGILGAGLAFAYYHKYREKELQAAELRTQLAQAQLEALRMQIHPHFLFNTLNSIVGLIRNHENKAAISMTTELGELLRHVLAHSERQEVPLREELDFLQRYLDIQQMRFSDRLELRIEIEPEALDAKVPTLMLQPLVENALRHGIAARATPGLLALSARRENGHLQIEVYNDGPVLPAGWRMEKCSGVGLANTNARLWQLYGARQSFALRNLGNSGVVATVAIPFCLESADAKSHGQREEDQNHHR
jgi:hypothetical protein